MVLSNSLSVISKGIVLWECEMKGYFDISGIFIVLEVFSRVVVVIFSLSEDRVEVLSTNRVGTVMVTRLVED